MKHIFLLFFISLLGSQSLFSKELTFTVFAKSGLKIRTIGSLSGKTIGTIPYGSSFESDELEKDFDGFVCKNPVEIIDGRKGKWIRANYNGISGFVFSGYCLLGQDFFVDNQTTNEDFYIVDIGFTCRIEKLDPNRNLYAIYSKSGKYYIKKTELYYKIIPEFIEKDSFDLIDDVFKSANPIKIISNINENIRLIISSKKALVEGEIFFEEFFDKKDGKYYSGKFLLPNKSINFRIADYNYNIYAYTKKNNSGINQYQLGIKKYFPNRDMKQINLSSLFFHWEEFETHIEFNTPELICILDINQDNLPDLVLNARQMTGTCGISSEFYLIISKNEDNYLKLESLSSTIFCDF